MRAPDRVHRPVLGRGGQRLPGGPGADRDRFGRPLRRRPRGVGPEDLLPARGPHRHDPGDHRRGGRLLGILGVVALYGMIGYAGLRTAKAARDRYSKLLAAGITSLILCQATLNFFAVLGMAPAHRRAAAVHLLREQQPDRAAGRHGPAAERGGDRWPGGRQGRAGLTGDRRRARWRRVVIAAGGTAGHVVPALAVADALRADGAGSRSSAANAPRPSWCPAAGYQLHQLAVRASTAAIRARRQARSGWHYGRGASSAAAAVDRRRRGARRRRLRRRAGRAGRVVPARSRWC